MMRYLWIAVLLMLVYGVVVGEGGTEISYSMTEDAKIDYKPHRIDLFEFSSKQNNSHDQLPSALLFAEKNDNKNDLDKRFFFAVLLNQTEPICAHYPDEGYSSAEDIGQQTRSIALLWGRDESLFNSPEGIDSESWSQFNSTWEEGKPRLFGNRQLVMQHLWKGCKKISWEKMAGMLNGENITADDEKTTSVDSLKANNPPLAAGTSDHQNIDGIKNKLSADDTTNLKGELKKKKKVITSLEASIKGLKGEISNKENVIIQLKKSVADVKKQKKVSAEEFISALLDNLNWKFWVVVAIIFSLIVAYIFILWFIAKLIEPIENDTGDILQWFVTTNSTLHDIKTQMPIRGASTADLSNQLKETYERIAEKAVAICDLNARFQALFATLQESEKTARDLGVDNSNVSLDDERFPTSLQMPSLDQSTEIKEDALQICGLLEEIKESHKKNTTFAFSGTKHNVSLKAHSDLVLDHIPGLLDRVLQFSEHISSLFDITLMKLSHLSDENHKLNKQLDEKSVEIKSRTKLAIYYSNVLADELKEIGYLDRKGEFDGTKFNEALTKFRNDNKKRPEFLEYGRSLSSLRRYLSSERVHDLPYFDAVGLRQLSIELDNKTSLSVLFQDQNPARPLKGHWKDFLQDIYRATLLLDTYWPNAHKDLRSKLEQARATTDLLLRSQGIAPHTLCLLDKANVNKTTIKETQGATIPEELERNETFRDRVKPLSDNVLTYCDVGFWGYDIIQNDQVTSVEPTLLVTKERGSRWE